MATFYGTIKGNRGMVTRTGSKTSGFKASAQSYDGSVITYLGYNDKKELIVNISISDDSSSFGETYFNGTLAELKNKLRG